MGLLLQLAFRNVLRHRVRTTITLSALVFGCAAIIFSGGFFSDMYLKLRDNDINSHTGHLQVFRRGYNDAGPAHPFDFLIDHPESALQIIRADKDVAAFHSVLAAGSLLSNGEQSVTCLAEGIDPVAAPQAERTAARNTKAEKTLPVDGAVIEDGRALSEAEPRDVILGHGLAEALNARVGDSVVLLSHTVSDSVNGMDVRVRGIFYTGVQDFDDYTLQMPLASVQELVRAPAIQSIFIRLQRTDDTTRVKSDLERRFRENNLDLEIKSWEDLSDFPLKAKMLLDRWFAVLKIIIALIMIFSVYNTLSMSIVERTGEIGTLMAMGTRRLRVIRLLLLEGTALGVMGGLCGVALGALITFLVSRIGVPMPPPPSFSMPWLSEPAVLPVNLAIAFMLAVFSSILSAVIPAVRASRLEIAEALRYTT